ncbi:MAG: VWA domain-containing protein [Cyclobacteriaceae bacterium]
MNHQRLLFEYSPLYIVPCILLGVGYAYVLYQQRHSWSLRTNQFLFLLRAVLVSLLAILLIGPILKLTTNQFEKPAMVVLIDNSSSLAEAIDSVQRRELTRELGDLVEELDDAGYDAKLHTLTDTDPTEIEFTTRSSDLAGAVRQVANQYEGQRLDGLVVLTDGIYNSGSSPLYYSTKMPVYTVGIGDTTVRTDLILRNLLFNKIAYQGNKYPLRAEVIVQGLRNQNVEISLYQKGKLIARENKNSGENTLVNFDFQLEAAEQGLQRLDVVVTTLNQERNQKNNRASAFVEVVEGKKKILIVAPAPHPDIKALRSVIEKNTNYELTLHIPGVRENGSVPGPAATDLVIFHQVLDAEGKTLPIYNRFVNSNTSAIYMIGSKSNLRRLASAGIPITFENPGQWDEVTPVVNTAFRDFTFSENTNAIFSRFPPLNVPFGKFLYPAQSNILLNQRIGSVATDRPLLFTLQENEKKIALLIGEGIWRWRLDEFAETRSTEVFDEVFGKLIQYASTQEDKRRFRCFPIQSEFTDAEPVIFEAQVYNELFEQVFGNRIDIQVVDDQGEIKNFNYTTGEGNTRYRIGGLSQGVYRYTASTTLNGATERSTGEFLVREQNLESQNLTADFGLLRKWADNTGGKFYRAAEMDQLKADLVSREIRSVVHSEESFNPLINLRLFFFMLLLFISTEWFLRKYLGAY